MAAIIGASTFSVVIVLSVLIICGLPLADMTMGGRFGKIVPKRFRLLMAPQLALQVLFVVTVLQMGGFISLWFSEKTTKTIGMVMAAYLSVNTVMNAISRSKRERYIMTPLSLVSAVCFWIAAIW